MKDEEKRRFPRVDVKSPVKFRIPTAKMDISMASIKNISGGGLCLLTNTTLKNGQIIQLEFGLPSDHATVIAMGEVAWVTDVAEPGLKYKFQIGVSFIEIDKQKQKDINRFVITRLKARVKEEIEKGERKKGGQRHSILAIDDDKLTLELIKNVFGDEFNVITASDGYDGVEKARVWRPDLILLDIVMPDMDGFSTLMLLKDFDETRDIPVLMLSMLRDKSKIFQAIRGGAQDYVLKPFSAESLLVKIKKIMEK